MASFPYMRPQILRRTEPCGKATGYSCAMDERETRAPVLLDARKSQLVLIDYQARLLPAIHDGENIARNAARLAQLAQALEIPAVATEQSPAKLGPSLPEVREACSAVIAKTYFDAYPDGLREPVQHAVANGRSQVVVAGVEAHVCLLQTAIGMLDDGLDVWVVVDACGSRSEHNREAALQRLQDSGATCVTTEMVGFEWVRHAGHPAFKTLQTLVR
jgi:nicotinamidase-related amidase